MECISKICETLKPHSFAIIIFITAIFFAILHLFPTFQIDGITIILIIIALSPLLAFYVDSIKTGLFSIQFAKQGMDILIRLEQVRFKQVSESKLILNKSHDESILEIYSSINFQLARLRQAIDFGYESEKTKILDELVNRGKLDCNEATVIKDAINLVDRGAQTKNIGSISAKVVITVGLKALESLKAIQARVQ